MARRRRGRSGWAIPATLLVVGLTLVFVSAAGGFLVLALRGVPHLVDAQLPDSPTPTRTASPAPTSSTASVPSGPADLRTLLLPVPTGATKLPAILGSADGTLSLTQATRFYRDTATGTRLLQEAGFRDGAERTFLRSREDCAFIVWLIRFGSAVAAVDFALVRLYGVAGMQTLPGVPSGRYATERSDGENLTTATFAKGPVAVIVVATTARTGGAELAVQTAQAQYARLP